MPLYVLKKKVGRINAQEIRKENAKEDKGIQVLSVLDSSGFSSVSSPPAPRLPLSLLLPPPKGSCPQSCRPHHARPRFRGTAIGNQDFRVKKEKRQSEVAEDVCTTQRLCSQGQGQPPTARVRAWADGRARTGAAAVSRALCGGLQPRAPLSERYRRATPPGWSALSAYFLYSNPFSETALRVPLLKPDSEGSAPQPTISRRLERGLELSVP